jgi:hypothetical protein
LSLAAGVALLLPFAPTALAASIAAIKHRALDWVRNQPPIVWSYDALRDGTANKSLFKLFLVLAVFGLWRHRSKAPLAPLFMATVMVGPFAAVAMLSWFGRPMMVERYVLMSLIAFLGLAAIGAAALHPKLGQILGLLLMVWLSVRALRHASGFWVDWKEAATIACAGSSGNDNIGVVPSYAVNVVRYYLPLTRRPAAFGLNSQCGHSQILIVNPGSPVTPRYMAELTSCYPHVLGRATRVEVRAR